MAGTVNIIISGDNKQALAALEGVVGGINKLTGLGSLIEELGGKLAAALTVGALVEFTRRAIEGADAIGKLAQKTGVAIQQLSGLGAVAAADDVSLQELQIGIKGLSEWMVKNGQASADVNEVLLKQADIFASMPDGAQKTALAMDRFGRAGQEMIPFLNKGAEAIRAQMEEARDLGAVVGPAFAASAAQFNDNLHRVRLVFQGFFNQIAEQILPTLNHFLEWFMDFAKQYEPHKAVIEGLVVIYKSFATVLFTLLRVFEAMGAAIGGFAGNLSVSGDPFEAWEAGADAADQVLLKLQKDFESLFETVSNPPKKTPVPIRTKEDFDREMAALKTQLAQQKLFFDQAGENQNVSAGEARKRQLQDLTLMERTLQAERTKNSTAYFTDHLIPEQEFLENEIALQRALLDLQKQRHELSAEDRFADRMRDNLRSLAEEWGNFGKNAANALTNSIQAGVNGVTDAIVDAIYMTKSWAQVFQQVGRAIVTELIRVVVQWIVQMTLVRALQKIFHTEQQVQATQRATAEAPGAALAATSSYGAAAIIGAVALAAILALALASAAGAFVEGGVIRGGEQLIRVNERGQEAVLNAQALANVGEGFVAGLNAGLPIHQAAAASPAAPSIKNNQQVTVAVFNDQAKMADWLRNQDGQNVIVDVVKANLHQITGRT